jgi:hypothetical protein
MASVKPTLPLGSPASSFPPGADLAYARSMAPPPSYARPMARRRSRAPMWFFAPLALAGGLFAAYRNDLLLDAARSLHQEERYLAAERAVLGVPGFGTPRSVAASSLVTTEPTDDHATDSVKTDRSALDSAPSTTPAPAVDEAPAKPKFNELPAVTPPPKVAEAKPSPEPAPRAVEPHKAIVAEKPVAKAAPPPVRAIAAAPAPRPAPASRPTPSSTKHDEGGVKAAKVVLAETDDDSAPARAPHRSSTAATKAAASFGSVAREEEPKPVAVAPKHAPKPAPPPPKPAAAPPPVVSSGNSSLDEAIRNAATKQHAPAKKKPAGAEYDPLNSDI